MPIVLAVDPGGTTGYSIALIDDDGEEVTEADQLPPQEFCAMAHVLASEWGTEMLVVCERFTISERTLRATKAGSYDAIETIGALRYLSKAYCGQDLVMQQPADVMNLFTDDRLKTLGWYRPGRPHANDSLRHLGYYLARHRGMRIPT